jgi:hypothetical protein
MGMKLSQLKQIIRETIQSLHEDEELPGSCVCHCEHGGDCAEEEIDGECLCICCDEMGEPPPTMPTKGKSPKKYRR